MRDFRSLDPTSLKAFYFSAVELNFTRAAKRAALTQSGISQHIQRLEAELGIPLFERQQRQMRLTEAGKELLRFVEAYLDSMESLFDRLREEGSALKGKVRYAMPDSCLFTPHFPLLLEKREREFPGVDVAVTICETEEVLRLLARGEIDFGFVTRPVLDKKISASEFAKEEYVLVGNRKKDLAFQNSADLKNLKFISYPGMEELFDHWLGSEFPRAKSLTFHDLNLVGEINSIRGAVTMVERGLGLGIFQKQCVIKELEAKTLFAYSGKTENPMNPIYIVQLKDQKQPGRVNAVIEAFWEMKRS